MTVNELNSQLLGVNMEPVDFFLYISVVCVIGVWIFLLAGLFGMTPKHDEDYPFGVSKQTASYMLMFAGLFCAAMIAIKFLLL